MDLTHAKEEEKERLRRMGGAQKRGDGRKEKEGDNSRATGNRFVF